MPKVGQMVTLVIVTVTLVVEHAESGSGMVVEHAESGSDGYFGGSKGHIGGNNGHIVCVGGRKVGSKSVCVGGGGGGGWEAVPSTV